MASAGSTLESGRFSAVASPAGIESGRPGDRARTRLQGGRPCRQLPTNITASASTSPSGQFLTPTAARAGKGLGEVTRHGLFHLGKMGEVGEKDIQLDDVGQDPLAASATALRFSKTGGSGHRSHRPIVRWRDRGRSGQTGERYRRPLPPGNKCRWRRVRGGVEMIALLMVGSRKGKKREMLNEHAIATLENCSTAPGWALLRIPSAAGISRPAAGQSRPPGCGKPSPATPHLAAWEAPGQGPRRRRASAAAVCPPTKWESEVATAKATFRRPKEMSFSPSVCESLWKKALAPA